MLSFVSAMIVGVRCHVRGVLGQIILSFVSAMMVGVRYHVRSVLGQISFTSTTMVGALIGGGRPCLWRAESQPTFLG